MGQTALTQDDRWALWKYLNETKHWRADELRDWQDMTKSASKAVREAAERNLAEQAELFEAIDRIMEIL